MEYQLLDGGTGGAGGVEPCAVDQLLLAMERAVVQREEWPVARAQEGYSEDGRGVAITWLGLELGSGTGFGLGPVLEP